jgi:hypothetical protein
MYNAMRYPVSKCSLRQNKAREKKSHLIAHKFQLLSIRSPNLVVKRLDLVVTRPLFLPSSLRIHVRKFTYLSLSLSPATTNLPSSTHSLTHSLPPSLPPTQLMSANNTLAQRNAPRQEVNLTMQNSAQLPKPPPTTTEKPHKNSRDTALSANADERPHDVKQRKRGSGSALITRRSSSGLSGIHMLDVQALESLCWLGEGNGRKGVKQQNLKHRASYPFLPGTVQHHLFLFIRRSVSRFSSWRVSPELPSWFPRV